MVAVHDRARVVDGDQPVGVAVERQTEIGPFGHHRGRERGRVRRSATVVDVHAVGPVGDHVHGGSRIGEHLAGQAAASPVGGIDDDRQPVESPVPDRLVQVAHVVAHVGVAIDQHADLSTRPGRRAQLVERAVDAGLDVVGQLAPADGEELDAVVGERVVRGRDHRPGAPAVLSDVGDARRGHVAEQLDAHAFRRETGGERRFEHAARPARIASDHELGGAEHLGGGAPEGERVRRRQFGVRYTPHAVRAETWAAHVGRRDRRRIRRCRRHRGQRLEYCGALRAFLRPYFFDSLARASRVSRPAFFSVGRASSSSSTRARAMPMRSAPA